MGSRRDRRQGGGTRLALTALALASCIPTSDGGVGPTIVETWSEPPEDAVVARVVRILDGDSILVDIGGSEVEIRLAGINAPEGDECHGEAAREAIAHLAVDDIRVLVVEKDRFGRSVAAVWHDRDLVNGVLASNGDALVLTQDSPWFQELKQAEDLAREAGRGLWSLDACGDPVSLPVRIEMTSPDPVGPDAEDLASERVTIVADGPDQIDLSGFVLRDESTANRLVLPAGTVVGPGAPVVVSSGCPPPPGVGWCSGTPIWNNSGDTALLLSPAGTVVAHSRFRPDGSGE